MYVLTYLFINVNIYCTLVVLLENCSSMLTFSQCLLVIVSKAPFRHLLPHMIRFVIDSNTLHLFILYPGSCCFESKLTEKLSSQCVGFKQL